MCRKASNNMDDEDLHLNLYQIRQASLLYHFSSIEFLDEIIARVRALTAFTDGTLPVALRIARDNAMQALGWTEGHFLQNWFSNGDVRLQNCLRALLAQKRMRSKDFYDAAHVSGALTGMSHLLPYGRLPEEEERFRELADEASAVAAALDTTVWHTWTDEEMTWSWEEYQHIFPMLPTFLIRQDVQGESGERPPRTGVYVPQDDSYGTLQFAWTGDSGGVLGQCETFSGLALEYIAAVGRERMWKSPTAAARVADWAETTDQYFDDWCRRTKKMTFPDMISSRNERAFEARSCRWYFVEQIPFRSENIDR